MITTQCAQQNLKLMADFKPFENKMMAAGMGDAAIRAFRRNYNALLTNETGMIDESGIEPASGVKSLDAIGDAAADAELLAQAVVILARAWACRVRRVCSKCAMARTFLI